MIIQSPSACRHGSYKGHTGTILQLLVLGDYLLSLGRDRKLLVWKIGAYAEPEVGPCKPCTKPSTPAHLRKQQMHCSFPRDRWRSGMPCLKHIACHM